MPKFTKIAKDEEAPLTDTQKTEKAVSENALARALVLAIESTRPQKKNAFNRRVGTPWTPPEGTAKIRLKRRIFQHGLPADEEILDNEEISLMNQLRPGNFLSGTVKVNRRKDRGLDIDYPIKTASQRLKLINQFGIRNLKELLAKCIEEAENPTKKDELAD